MNKVKNSNATKIQERQNGAASPKSLPTPEMPSSYPRKYHFGALTALLLLILAMFADTLLFPSKRVLSIFGADVSFQFLFWREFAFEQLRHGNLALWNPYIYGGAPFMGGFQAAQLYPPNWLFAFLPIALAINLSIVVNLFLAGAFTYLWAASRRLHPLAALLAAVIYVFGGAHFLHIFAGHLPNLCTMAWAPLLFFALDKMIDRPWPMWWLVGMLAVTMQILAGHPQYVFYTGIAATLYVALHLPVCPASQRLKTLFGFVAIYGGAVLLSAVQLLTGLGAQSESVRTGNLPYEFVASYSFAPENLLTLICPTFFGDYLNVTYWGRWLMWEVNVFIGVTGLLLVVWGILHGQLRRKWGYLAMAALTFLLALGHYTPLFRLLYHVVPGFDKFRGNSKFIFLTSMFLAMLAAMGMDWLLRDKTFRRRPALVAFGLALFLGVMSVVIFKQAHSAGPVWRFFLWVAFESEGLMTNAQVQVANVSDFPLQAGMFATFSLVVAALTAGLLSLFLYLRRFTFKATYAVALLAIVELFCFGRLMRPTFPLADAQDPTMKQFLETHPGDYRIFQLNRDRNKAMSLKAPDIWGYDPMVLRRYAEFMTFTQGQNPDQATQDLQFDKPESPLLRMLRCGYAFRTSEQVAPEGVAQAKYEVRPFEDPLPQVQVVQEYAVVPKRDAIFAELSNPSFDPRRKVILETQPDPAPANIGKPGSAKVVKQSTDWLEIEADVVQPSILLVTDAYSRDWRARGLKDSVQASYQIQPANYCLRAVALKPGHHHLRMEYAPRAFAVGSWVSLLSLAGFGAWGLVLWRRRPREAGEEL